MLPLSVMEECLTGLPSLQTFLFHTYCYLLYDKKVFVRNNNYYYLIIKHLTLYPIIYYQARRPINTVYKK